MYKYSRNFFFFFFFFGVFLKKKGLGGGKVGVRVIMVLV